ncbi:carbon storage regulator CsrA [Curtobacterium sp. VKM Ac-2865]|uniref:carbon storage regulator CsrA n=1 Tax=Curtobacterium sp. VKM Ac-2865 TaxID=2783817 RepID=UPI00188BA7FA|nr:carbon storage regulator CsrA [Curtobacterium sp. VKM Ac-2865]MBF4581574.1 carbon storage regulator CsrA [Curtobacterium sp. VKM Ac-2865]
MLVLTRKVGERILIGDDIVITVLDSRGDGVRIGIDAPRGVKIQREEVVRAVTEANVEASRSASDDAEARLRAALGGSASGGSASGGSPAPTDDPTA